MSTRDGQRQVLGSCCVVTSCHTVLWPLSRSIIEFFCVRMAVEQARLSGPLILHNVYTRERLQRLYDFSERQLQSLFWSAKFTGVSREPYEEDLYVLTLSFSRRLLHCSASAVAGVGPLFLASESNVHARSLSVCRAMRTAFLSILCAPPILYRIPRAHDAAVLEGYRLLTVQLRAPARTPAQRAHRLNKRRRGSW